MRGIDASGSRDIQEKIELAKAGGVVEILQVSQLKNPDSRVMLESASEIDLLNKYCYHNLGICSGDSIRFYRKFWEVGGCNPGWEWMQGTVSAVSEFGGCETVVYWQGGNGDLYDFVVEKLGEEQVGSWLRGKNAWGRKGVLISAMQDLPATAYLGGLFDENSVVIVAQDPEVVPALWAFCSDDSYSVEVRKTNQTLKVRGDLVKVPFDLPYWQQVAAERYPNGLPKPYSDDPTQWIFHGHPQPASEPLQVAVARLLGYRWPAESDSEMELSDQARAWIARSAGLNAFADDDGIVCLPPVRGEKAAADRLENLLEAAFGTDWTPQCRNQLLEQVGAKSLDAWLRDKFFEQHCKLFHHRPFIWHVWDGLKDGFSALVNYHKLTRANLERLIYTYLGDWIRTQQHGVEQKLDGADIRLSAAQNLKARLEAILAGEAPYDIFVRWKPLAEQPIGWEPDLNDGVRLNIRPFMTAEVLRHNKKPKLNIEWKKDRGTDVPSAPWYTLGLQYGEKEGARINDHHLTLAAKKAART